MIPVLRKGIPDERAFVGALAAGHVHGLPVDWSARLAGARPVDLPTYAFQHQRYWLDAPPAAAARPSDPAAEELWAAVESGDVAELAALLGTDAGAEQRAALETVAPLLAAWRHRTEAAAADVAASFDTSAAGAGAPDGPADELADSPDDGLGPEAEAWRLRFDGLPSEAQEEMILALLYSEIAAALGHDAPGHIGPDDELLDLGFTSFAALELCNRLKTATGIALPPAAVFDHPTPAALVRHLRTEHLTAAL